MAVGWKTVSPVIFLMHKAFETALLAAKSLRLLVQCMHEREKYYVVAFISALIVVQSFLLDQKTGGRL